MESNSGTAKIQLEELLLQGQTVQFPPTGTSMYPLFIPEKHDQAIVEPVGDRKLKKGDVVLYRRDGSTDTYDIHNNRMGILVIHRICKVAEEGFYLVGDNQYMVEGPLRRDQIRGIMTARIRNGKTMKCTSLLYRIVYGGWLILLPCRKYVYAFMRCLRSIKK